MAANNLRYSDEQIQSLKESAFYCNTVSEAIDLIARTLKVERGSAQKLNTRHGIWKKPEDTTDVDIITEDPSKLEEVIKLCNIDESIWKVKSFTVNQRKEGFAWRVSLQQRPNLIREEEMLTSFITKAAAFAPAKWKVAPKSAVNKVAAKDCLYILNIQDLHLAKLAWGKETGGADWDIRISEKVYLDTVDELIAKAPIARIEEVVLIIGSDFLQVDTDSSTTTAGTYVDSDSRQPKIFEVASKMLTDTIEKLAAQFKVRAIVIPGNHDAISSQYLGHYVAAWFRNHPNVTIDNSPKSRKYLGYGKTLIGFDHGNETKLKDLPLILMRENQTTISQYKYQEFLVGHFHHESVEDIKGIKVRIAPALCPPDRWHGAKGYIGNMRQSQGLLYNRTNGLEAIFYSVPLD